MFSSLLRILKFSLQDITRNIWLSVVTITILILAMFSINTLILTQTISTNAVKAIKEKININLYLTSDSSEIDILNLKDKIKAMDRVKDVKYISKQEALDSFRASNENNEEVLQALVELGQNPLSPSLVITPYNADEVADLIEELKVLDSEIIESRDFSDNSLILDKINNITKRINDIGIFIIAIFVITSLLVIYNSIKVAIYTHKKEIEIMRLVGASNVFIYAPYLMSSVVYTLVALIIIIAISFPLLSLIQPYLEVFFVDYNVNVVSYFTNNFLTIFGIQFLGIVAINILASYIAVKKYARI
ncbi:MAG TPA: permease-like cell division protein FtsX [bacterium]|nr:permease-like cell division protein FtsX [bacterium]